MAWQNIDFGENRIRRYLAFGIDSIMGFSLHIQRVDGREGDLPTTDLSTSLRMFDSIPWKEEMTQWESVSEEEREIRRPLFQLFDDSGHSVHITAYSDDLIALAYNYPSGASPFGMSYETEEGYMGTDQYPKAELGALFDCFFASDTQAMLSLLKKYSMSHVSEETE